MFYYFQWSAELDFHLGPFVCPLMKCNFLKCFLLVTLNITPDGVINFASPANMIYETHALYNILIILTHDLIYSNVVFSFLKFQPSAFISFLFRELLKSFFQDNFISLYSWRVFLPYIEFTMYRSFSFSCEKRAIFFCSLWFQIRNLLSLESVFACK